MPVRHLGRGSSFAVVIACLSLVELGYFPHFKNIGFYCNDPKLSFKYDGETVSATLLFLVTLFAPYITVMFTEWLMYRLGRYPRVTLSKRPWLMVANNWYIRYILGFLFLFFLTDVIKLIIGEPRPHFFETCKPLEAKNCTAGGYVSDYTCTAGAKDSLIMKDASMSFPSGHASFSVYTGLFLFWYLQRRFVVPSYTLTVALQFLAIIWAMVASVSRIIDHRHHWWDVLAGALLGAFIAVYNLYLIHLSEHDNGTLRENEERNAGTKVLKHRFEVQYNTTSESLIERSKNKLEN